MFPVLQKIAYDVVTVFEKVLEKALVLLFETTHDKPKGAAGKIHSRPISVYPTGSKDKESFLRSPEES